MNTDDLKNSFKKNHIIFNDKHILNLEKLLSFTLEANKKMNLTALVEEPSFREKMIYDSALPLSQLSLTNKKCVDVGTGAGFPGIVLSILSNTHFDLVDSNAKKIKHLEYLAKDMNLDLSCYLDRIENFSRKHIEEYDYVFVRAVSELAILLEIISPMVKVGGTIVCYKGANYEEEINRASKIIKILDLEIKDIQKEILPFSLRETNILYFIKKNKTNKKYPRSYNIICGDYKNKNQL